MYAVLVSMAAAGVLTATIAAQQPVDPQTLGPKIGERLIDFSLPDQHGVTRSLRSLVGPKGVVLVFFRSADW
jgi:cytochrome oxidase Cu insertion factor (SCO1/SenC/PrrC family)